MPVLDWIFLAVLLLSALLGAWRGLVYEVLTLLSWVAALVLAYWFAPDLALRLPIAEASEMIRYAAAFILLFILCMFMGALLARLSSKLFAAAGLRPADRALGGAFGLVRGLVLLLAATVVIAATPLRDGVWWQESVSRGFALTALAGLKPALPAAFGRYLP